MPSCTRLSPASAQELTCRAQRSGIATTSMWCVWSMACLSIVAGAPSVTAETARGTVYLDSNNNQRKEPNEQGLPGVRVSDGVRFATTDKSGAYQLEIADEAVLFVIKPSGYKTPVSPHNLPQFYYIHQPKGSPKGLRYTGIAPTGPLPQQIDFPLQEQDEPNVFEAILFADTQPQTDVELDYIREDVVSELIGTDAAFGMTMGDVGFDDLSILPRLNAIIGQIGVPWYNVPGNHELNLKAQNDRYSLETFKRIYGPPYYSFNVGGAHFVVLDNIEYQGNGKSDPGDVRGAGGYIANFGKAQLNWLKADLAAVPNDSLVFITMHSPLATALDDGPGVTTQDRRDLFKLLSGRPNLYSVAGHTHTTEHMYFGKEDGFRGPGTFHHHILTAVSGSWWSGPFDERGIPTTWQRDGTPNGYHVLEVDGNKAAMRFKAASQPADFQMNIMFDVHHSALRPDGMRDFRHGELFDGRMSIAQVPAAGVLVNLFDGGPKSRVRFQINDGPMLPMSLTHRADPKVNELFARNVATKKSWVNAIPSTHLFEADLPDDLQAGVHTLSVEAIDEFGKVHHAHAVLEITGQ